MAVAASKKHVPGVGAVRGISHALLSYLTCKALLSFVRACCQNVLQDALCETAYQAEVAALTFEVALEGAAGLSLRLDGFSHKLPALAEAVFTTLATMKVWDLKRRSNMSRPDRCLMAHSSSPDTERLQQHLFPPAAAMVHVKHLTPGALQV